MRMGHGGTGVVHKTMERKRHSSLHGHICIDDIENVVKGAVSSAQKSLNAKVETSSNTFEESYEDSHFDTKKPKKKSKMWVKD